MAGGRPQTGAAEKRIKVLKKTVTGRDDKGKSLMVVEDKSLRGAQRFNVAIAPYDFRVGLFGNTYKTKEVNYVSAHMVDETRARGIYEKMKEESK